MPGRIALVNVDYGYGEGLQIDLKIKHFNNLSLARWGNALAQAQKQKAPRGGLSSIDL
jgi:hypothetical protein